MANKVANQQDRTSNCAKISIALFISKKICLKMSELSINKLVIIKK